MRARFGLVFQHAGLLDWLDVQDNVAFPLVERQVSRAVIRESVDDILDRLGLAKLRERMPHQLSTGERKRVALARAMVMRPEILIYDEPTTGQDPPHVATINAMIVEAQQSFDVTSLVISHDMASTFRIAHTVALLHEGRIVACGPPDVVHASRDAVVQRFLRASAM
jgi:ABC-type transporter Mla maintaining outer membrane lipid asymmetry ATPase subunit MlaF